MCSKRGLLIETNARVFAARVCVQLSPSIDAFFLFFYFNSRESSWNNPSKQIDKRVLPPPQHLSTPARQR